jgi:NifU-like protein involved in Fe-S cluster formation/bacterioferritin-associated ferredoxin
VPPIYPIDVLDRLRSPRHAGENGGSNAVGRSVSLSCGTYVTIQMTVDPSAKRIEKVSFRSNGCGFMIAAADVLADKLEGSYLADLNATAGLVESLGPLTPGREPCRDVVIAALLEAFADHRRRQVEEFVGDKALICTCFGVSEEVIEQLVMTGVETVEEAGRRCRAGTGCGACQMLIQEIIDSMRSGR